MNRPSEERRIGWRYHGQWHCGATRLGWLPCPAVGSELAANLPAGNAGVRPTARRRAGDARARQVGRKAGGRCSHCVRKATAAAAGQAFDLATVAWREAKPVALVPEHQRGRSHDCELETCWPT